jgi:hypothetical protein
MVSSRGSRAARACREGADVMDRSVVGDTGVAASGGRPDSERMPPARDPSPHPRPGQNRRSASRRKEDDLARLNLFLRRGRRVPAADEGDGGLVRFPAVHRCLPDAQTASPGEHGRGRFPIPGRGAQILRRRSPRRGDGGTARWRVRSAGRPHPMSAPAGGRRERGREEHGSTSRIVHATRIRRERRRSHAFLMAAHSAGPVFRNDP